jgi:hypothetical protein
MLPVACLRNTRGAMYPSAAMSGRRVGVGGCSRHLYRSRLGGLASSCGAVRLMSRSVEPGWEWCITSYQEGH